MEMGSPWILYIALAAGVVLVPLGLAIGLRSPPPFGPDEILRGPNNPTQTTIARNDLIAIRFLENSERVVEAKFWGQGDKGIVLSLAGDQTDYLLTNDGDWFEETRFRIKPDIRLMLIADGVTIITADRVPDNAGGWRRDEAGNFSKAYDIDYDGERLQFARLARGKFALRRGHNVVGIATIPLPTGIFSWHKSRIELPASLPLEIRLFIALLVEVEDHKAGVISD